MDTENLKRKHLGLRDDLRQELASVARQVGMELDLEDLVGEWYGDAFVAGAASQSPVSYGEGRYLGVVLVSAPADYELEAEQGPKLGNGCYAVQAFVAPKEGQGLVKLSDPAQGTSVEFAMAAPVGGGGSCSIFGAHECSNPGPVTIKRDGCQICFYWDCDSMCHVSCFTLPGFLCKEGPELVATA